MQMSKTAVYRVYDSDDALLYVGMSRSPFARFLSHSKSSDWFDSVTRLELAWYPDREQAKTAESAAILKESPKHNVTGTASEIDLMAEAEALAGGISQAMALFGVSQANWYDYRAGRRPVPKYVEASIWAHLRLSDRAIRARLKENISD